MEVELSQDLVDPIGMITVPVDLIERAVYGLD